MNTPTPLKTKKSLKCQNVLFWIFLVILCTRDILSPGERVHGCSSLRVFVHFYCRQNLILKNKESLCEQLQTDSSVTNTTPRCVTSKTSRPMIQDSHLRRSGPPALVSHAEAAQALSLGHLVLPWALVLPTGHRVWSFLLQLRKLLHAAVDLQEDTFTSIIMMVLALLCFDGFFFYFLLYLRESVLCSV